MMKIMIEESKDADKIAKLNESVQNLHYENIRIIGAGYWRGGKRKYEEENKIQ